MAAEKRTFYVTVIEQYSLNGITNHGTSSTFLEELRLSGKKVPDATAVVLAEDDDHPASNPGMVRLIRQSAKG